jgi:F0F1-type ATP synthase epsilon subunit
MAKPQFAKVNGKVVCIVSTSGIRKKGGALERAKLKHAAKKERKQQKEAENRQKQAKADKSTASEDIHNGNG